MMIVDIYNAFAKQLEIWEKKDVGDEFKEYLFRWENSFVKICHISILKKYQ